MGITPQVVVLANDIDITDLIKSRLISITVTDESGIESDLCRIKLSDHIHNEWIELPTTGAELKVQIGYDGKTKEMGSFVVDEVGIQGPPDVIDIKARSAGFDISKRSPIHTQKTRSWDNGLTIGEFVETIASNHGLEYRISEQVKDKELPHFDQFNESDINLLVRVSKQYNAIVKLADGVLIVASESESKQVGSEMTIPVVILNPSDISSYQRKAVAREKVGTVIATYRDFLKAEDTYESAGEGTPVVRLKHLYKDSKTAKEGAKSELLRQNNGAFSIRLALPGRLDIIAEGIVELKGFRSGVDGRWKVKRVNHVIDSSGYRLGIECIANELKKEGSA